MLPSFLWLLLPSGEQVPSHNHQGVGMVQVRPHGARVQSDRRIFLGNAQAQLATIETLISQHLNCVAFHTPCAVVGLRKKEGERRKEPIPALLQLLFHMCAASRGSSGEGHPTQVTHLLGRLQSLFQLFSVFSERHYKYLPD